VGRHREPGVKDNGGDEDVEVDVGVGPHH
jgi:hypothetical protein